MSSKVLWGVSVSFLELLQVFASYGSTERINYQALGVAYINKIRGRLGLPQFVAKDDAELVRMIEFRDWIKQLRFTELLPLRHPNRLELVRYTKTGILSDRLFFSTNYTQIVIGTERQLGSEVPIVGLVIADWIRHALALLCIPVTKDQMMQLPVE